MSATESSPMTPEAMRAALRAAPAITRDAPFPNDWWQHLAAHGLLGLGFCARAGRAPADWAAIASLSAVIARETTSVGLCLAWLMNEMLGRLVIGPHTGGQQDLLRAMASGTSRVALAISEPGIGAHPKHMSCRAVAHDGDWVLDGEKSYVSGGPSADAFVVLAITREAAGRKSFDAFVVDAHAPGLTRLLDSQASVLSPLGHCGLTLNACRVSTAGLLDTGGQAFGLISKPLRTIEDTLLASVMIGAMQAELDALALWLRGVDTIPAVLRGLGALRLELAALERLAALSAQQLESLGADDRQGDLNAGLRMTLQRWQDSCDAFAAPFVKHIPDQPRIARDVRTVLGIARGVVAARQLAAGVDLLNTKEPG